MSKTWIRSIIALFEQGMEKKDVIDMGWPISWVEEAWQLYIESSEEDEFSFEEA